MNEKRGLQWTVPLPRRMQKLVRNAQGYVVPWFVAGDLQDGGRDFRVMDPDRWVYAVKFKVCWLCGQAGGAYKTFVIGPMCTLNRITQEPPCHLDCATYAAKVCPFLTRPEMVRRTTGTEEYVQPAGLHSGGNPGAMVLWTTKSFKTVYVDPVEAEATGGVDGWLIEIGPATSVEWWIKGSRASYAGALHALEAGMQKLAEMAAEEFDPGKALLQLQVQFDNAAKWLPTQWDAAKAEASL